ncbi:glycosyltransferase [Kocuria flava]|uniref:glycosyltransferase n=1 Tax=Kocuria flava TaxID=446860 RepID=UPI001FF52BF4|nr:glycosyltransferase [Kocuria flava]MCJ8504807.1 glycosyltransferase [Kocuria flava]
MSKNLSNAHVALLVPKLSGGGAEFVAAEWAKRLEKSCAAVTVISTHAGDSSDAGLIREIKLQADNFSERIFELRKTLRRDRPDVLVALMPHWNVLALLASRGLRTKVLISGRNTESVLSGAVGGSFKKEMALAKSLYRRADGYIAISHPVAAEAIAKYGLNPDRVWVVPNPATAKIDEFQATAARAKRAAGEQLADSLTIAVPARLVRQKQPLLAIDTAVELRKLGVDAAVDYFGDGPMRSEVTEYAEHHDVNAHFWGWVNNWFEGCATNAVVLLPSVAEGFGNVLLEAAAFGVPAVVCSRTLGAADAVVPGITGELTLDHSPSSFAAAVLRARKLRPGDIEGWLRRFSPSTSGENLEQALEQTLASHR